MKRLEYLETKKKECKQKIGETLSSMTKYKKETIDKLTSEDVMLERWIREIKGFES